jgi:hypothetical protein
MSADAPERRFFTVTRWAGLLTFAIQHGDAPHKVEKEDRSNLVYQYELTGRIYDAPLDRLREEYIRRWQAGTLPPSNVGGGQGR